MNQLKLNVLSKNKIDEKDLNFIRGGSANPSSPCGCACAKAATYTNGGINQASGLHSPGHISKMLWFYPDVVVTP